MPADGQAPSTLLGQLATQAAAKAAPAVGVQTLKWTQLLLDKVNAQLMPNLPPEVQGLVAAAMATVKANEQLISDTTVQGFTALVSHLALGQEDQARQVWLSGGASFDDLMNTLDKDDAATQAGIKARADTWASVKNVALSFLEAAGKAALPILLSVVPV